MNFTQESYEEGVRLAGQAVQTIVDSGDIGIFLHIINTLPGDIKTGLNQGFFAQVAELAAQAVELAE